MINKRLTIRNVYEAYPYKQDELSAYYCTKQEFVDINKAFFLLLTLYLIETGNEYTFPGGLGSIKVRKRRARMDQQFIDFKRSKEVGKRVHHMNMHSNGYYARFKWYKRKITLANKKAFKFIPVRAAKRHLAKCIKERNVIINYTIDN